MATHCPTCGQPIIKGPRRVCAHCGKPIGGRHKWHFGDDGRARHRVCGQPDSYATEPAQPEAQAPLIESEVAG